MANVQIRHIFFAPYFNINYFIVVSLILEQIVTNPVILLQPTWWLHNVSKCVQTQKKHNNTCTFHQIKNTLLKTP